jgi:hypothetical protein
MQINSYGSDQNRLLEMLNRKSVSQMASQVQAGDISDAQKTLASVQQVEQSLGLDSSAGSSSGGVGYKTNFDPTAFLSAVQSGDLQGAQSAWQQVQAKAQSAWSVQSDSDGDGCNSAATTDLTNLLTSVSSGDVSGMQAAGAAFGSDLSALLGSTSANGASTSGQAGSQSTSSENPLLKDLQSLVTAAQSGDTAGAQSAVQQLQQDMQTAAAGPTGHHHHHHHHDAGGASQAATPPVIPPVTPVTTDIQTPAVSTDTSGGSLSAAS